MLSIYPGIWRLKKSACNRLKLNPNKMALLIVHYGSLLIHTVLVLSLDGHALLGKDLQIGDPSALTAAASAEAENCY